MTPTLRPIMVVPAVLGLIIPFLILIDIHERRKTSTSPKISSGLKSSLPKARLINLQTNQDDYEKVMKGRVLLIFLTRGCGACKKEIPNITEALPSLAAKMSVYGVYIEDRSDVEAFIEENQIKFPILLDRGGRIFADLGITLIPAKVLMQDGTIIKTWFGSSPNKSKLIEDVSEARWLNN